MLVGVVALDQPDYPFKKSNGHILTGSLQFFDCYRTRMPKSFIIKLQHSHLIITSIRYGSIMRVAQRNSSTLSLSLYCKIIWQEIGLIFLDSLKLDAGFLPITYYILV